MINISEYLLGKNKTNNSIPKETWSIEQLVNWIKSFGIKSLDEFTNIYNLLDTIYYQIGKCDNPNTTWITIRFKHKEKYEGEDCKIDYGVVLKPKPNESDKCILMNRDYFPGYELIEFDDAVTLLNNIMLENDINDMIEVFNNYKNYINNYD